MRLQAIAATGYCLINFFLYEYVLILNQSPVLSLIKWVYVCVYVFVWRVITIVNRSSLTVLEFLTITSSNAKHSVAGIRCIDPW
jgi:hypothetical protein